MKKKKFKGMTLIEVIVAIAVLGIAGLVLAEVGRVATNTMYRTNHLNRKINSESPTVNVKNVGALEDDDKEGEVTITITNSTGSQTFGTYTAQKYSTKSLDTNAENDKLFSEDLNLEFYVIETESETS